MKVMIWGAGIVGISSAWYLADLGYEVIVVDRNSQVAMETSFANAGQLSYGYTTPWAAPNVPKKALKWLFKRHAPLIIRPDGSLFQLQWLWKMFRQCSEQNYLTNKSRMVRISEYSRQLMEQLSHDIPRHTYEGRQKGTLQIFRTQKEIDAIQEDIEVLHDFGVAVTMLTRVQDCLQYEPGLAPVVDRLAGALYLPGDATGDCHLFAKQLFQKCCEKGVQFQFNSSIDNIEFHRDRITAVVINGQRVVADNYVCALGSFSRPMLKTLGIALPVYPIKGYSLTIPIQNEQASPTSTILDETYKVAITRFDERIRIGGMAELSGYTIKLIPQRRETLETVMHDLFPQAAIGSDVSFWSGLRPTTPDGTPIIGGSRFANLFINTGHGTLGWTMGVGSGKILADIVSGQKPDIAVADLSLARYS